MLYARGSPLTAACRDGRMATVHVLLEYDADPDGLRDRSLGFFMWGFKLITGFNIDLYCCTFLGS